ncbi:MAG TPA: CoA transferase [Mycobacteriales bacterium]|nr:CoA transferase [Mycobacteriales bacterium]
MTLLGGLRVLDLSSEIAGPYATKLMADAGADVIKVETAEGDPLRRWSASHRDLAGDDGALFRYLNATKRAVVGDLDDAAVHALLVDADVLVEDGSLADDDLTQARAANPRLIVVSITPFGRTGSWARRPATEFTLQALCASTASRGLVDRPPLHVGGRLGEWITGTYAAVAALATTFAGGADPRGEHVDVSMLECMALTLGGFSALHVSLSGALEAARTFTGPSRSVEVPSIEPTADGLVGLCTITGQQFGDLMVLAGHPELSADPRFATAMARSRHITEFTALLHEWTTARTTAQVIEEASLLRVPVAPVGQPDTIPTFDHLVVRGVYEPNPAGFVQPRPPYRVSGVDRPPVTAAPRLGEHAGAAWGARAIAHHDAPVSRPLAGLRVTDLTAFWAGPSASSMLAALGADVIHVESVQRPDGMRFSSAKPPGEPGWYEWSAGFQHNNANKRGITLDLGDPRGRDAALDLIATSDVVIENFSPRVLDAFGITWDVVHARNPRTVMVRMPAFGLDGPWRDRTGFAQTMEQVSGMAWMSGYPDGLPVIPRGACDPLAGMHAVTATLAALHERERSGEGRFVEVTMLEAALATAAEMVIEHSAYGTSLHRDGNRGPVAAPQGLYACAGREQWLALAVVDDAQWSALTGVLASSELSDPRFAEAAGRRAHHDVIDELLNALTAARDLGATVEALVAAGVPAAPVTGFVGVYDLIPLRERRFLEVIDGPVVGRHEVLGVPFRFASRTEPWVERPAPTLGQHTDEVLAELGFDAGARAALREDGVTGTTPRGAA